MENDDKNSVASATMPDINDGFSDNLIDDKYAITDSTTCAISNEVIDFGALKKLKISSLRILSFCLAKISHEKPTPNKDIILKISRHDLFRIFEDLSPDQAYRILASAKKTSIDYKTPSGEGFEHFIRGAFFNKKLRIFEIKINKDALKYVTGLKEFFLLYDIKSISNITTAPAFKLFLHLQRYAYKKKWVVSIDELRALLDCEKKYKRTNNFIYFVKKILIEMQNNDAIPFNPFIAPSKQIPRRAITFKIFDKNPVFADAPDNNKDEKTDDIEQPTVKDLLHTQLVEIGVSNHVANAILGEAEDRKILLEMQKVVDRARKYLAKKPINEHAPYTVKCLQSALKQQYAHELIVEGLDAVAAIPTPDNDELSPEDKAVLFDLFERQAAMGKISLPESAWATLSPPCLDNNHPDVIKAFDDYIKKLKK